MTITFHGAARNVTGSKHLIKLDNGTQILLDCGMFQGLDEADELNEHFGFRPDLVSYVILSHAHIDHCGLLPRMVAEGFKGTIFATAPTMDLAGILLADSAKIQVQDAEFSNKNRRRSGQAEIQPLYTEEDVIATMGLFKIVDFNEDFEIEPRITLRFTDTGHIIGSAAVHLTILEDGKFHQLTFSGDVGRYGDLLLKSPQTFPQADYILLESTYGDSLHKDLEPIEGRLKEVIQHTCIVKGGKLIIPAFSVGRTQELLYALNALELKGILPDVPFYVDSPLSLKATEVLKDHPDEYNRGVQEVMKRDDDIFMFKGLKFIESVEESKSLNDDPRPCVIISSSGMAEAGRVKHHIRNNINNQKNTILMVGYAEPSSLAGRLLRNEKVVRIFGEEYDVRADIEEIKSMSAHGDYEDLLKFISCQDPEQVKAVYLVHGEYDVQTRFKQKIEEAGFRNVRIPAQHQMEEL
ncbi:MBL fold metallo-hydrolase RNA specificity domain-containing protein [Pedobacter sp. SYSU D00535]|uniref:MBL fold metallo-hydrolase RNA specificity domain-containing protein n=1 Tax=Pedobacter sp. SYSU D00535 TaxID=2810308 RepID=UPI001A965AF2|nr:MBL fold metallo-hydrolase [Pedobacter sp. SYSU D00535]